jgi:DNA-binding CsgD family transcriptional regulator
MGRFRERRADLGLLMDLRDGWLAGSNRRYVSEPRRLVQDQHRLTVHQVTELVQAYREGATVAVLADRFDIHRHTVTAHLERREVSRRQPATMSASHVKEAARLYHTGLSLAAVGQVLGFSANTVRKYLLEAGVRIRQRPGTR